MKKNHLVKYLLISPSLPVGGFCYSEGLESYLSIKKLEESDEIKELIKNEVSFISEKPFEGNLKNAMKSFKLINSKKSFFACTYNYLGYPSCLLYTSPSPRDKRQSRMPSSA